MPGLPTYLVQELNVGTVFSEFEFEFEFRFSSHRH